MPQHSFNQCLPNFNQFSIFEAGHFFKLTNTEDMWHKECTQIFHDSNAFLGIDCQLEVFINREKMCKNRPIGMAEYQYLKIHGKNICDIRIDSTKYSTRECAQKIMSYINSNEPNAFRKIYNSYYKFNHST